MNDVVYAIQSTSGCHAYVRDAEGLTSLRQFAYGSNTRWNYWIDVAERLQPATRVGTIWSLPSSFTPGSWRRARTA